MKFKRITWLLVTSAVFSLCPHYNVRAQTNVEYKAGVEYFLSNKENVNNINRWNIDLSEDEKYLLAQILYCEARGESDTGQQAVVEVIFNRYYASFFPNTIYEILSQRNQFESWKKHFKVSPTEKEFNNIDKVLNGETYILPYETLYFSTMPANNDIEITIGGHVFCNQSNYEDLTHG